MSEVSFSELIGKTVSEVIVNDDRDLIRFVTHDGETYRMWHEQDCCESVSIDDICGDIKDIIGSPIIMAEEVISEEDPEGVVVDYPDSFTWTFYKLATNKGAVTIRWYGSSNGYYSESVSFGKDTA